MSRRYDLLLIFPPPRRLPRLPRAPRLLTLLFSPSSSSTLSLSLCSSPLPVLPIFSHHHHHHILLPSSVYSTRRPNLKRSLINWIKTVLNCFHLFCVFVHLWSTIDCVYAPRVPPFLPPSFLRTFALIGYPLLQVRSSGNKMPGVKSVNRSDMKKPQHILSEVAFRSAILAPDIVR